MHLYLPEAHDEHLFTLELLVQSQIKERNMCLTTLMGNRDFTINLSIDALSEDEDMADNNAGNNLRENSFQFVSLVPDKTLRCLKI